MKKTALLVLLAVSFNGLAGAQESRVIATVNGETITAGELAKNLWWQHAPQGLSDLIDERLLLAEAARLNIPFDAKAAEQRFETIASAYKDKKEFEKNLKAANRTEKDVKDLIKRQALIRALVITAKNITPADADITAFFEQNKTRLGKPESAKLRQIFLTSKEAADDAYVALSAGADFGKLSALKSNDENLKKTEGDLGYISRGMLLPEIEKEVFALKAGQYTKPLAIGTSYSIFKLEDLKPAEPAVLDETLKTNIKIALINEAITQKLPELITELKAKAKIEIKP